MGYHLSRLLRVRQGLGRLLAQPLHDRDAIEPEYEQSSAIPSFSLG